MTPFLVFGLTALTAAASQASPGVWDQLQSGLSSPQRGTVRTLDMTGSQVWFTTESKDPSGQVTRREDRLCAFADGTDDSRESDEVRAALLKAKIEILMESRRTGKPVEFGAPGPWKPCVSNLRAISG